MLKWHWKASKQMIRLTRLNHTPLVVNCDLIEHIEMTPDTVISLTTGQRITVLETTEQVIGRVIEFRRLLLQAPEIQADEAKNEN
jgi:flagellar protein FlbD